MVPHERVAQPLSATDGPEVHLVRLDSLAAMSVLDDQRIDPAARAARIESRQVGIARRMIS